MEGRLNTVSTGNFQQKTIRIVKNKREAEKYLNIIGGKRRFNENNIFSLCKLAFD